MILQGNNIELLRTLAENSVDSVTTDPPYGLSFMGKAWDYDVPTVELWKEVLRVLKPGGHLLSFSSARTYHRMVVNVEDAGFEIRDQIMWVYGSGFPKSHNVGKALNKKADYELQTAWDGWGTALKPSHEPIVMARKPFKGTVADNVLEHGTGGINIDASRVGTESVTINTFDDGAKPFGDAVGEAYTTRQSEGRYPANFIHDGSDEVVSQFPYTKSGKMGPQHTRHTDGSPDGRCYGKFDKDHPLNETIGDEGSAARFFYCAKANKKERGTGNIHPTVKPLRLMEYLVKLITPPGGTVLDPFMGSGSTGMAAVGLGFNFIGMELDEEYCNIAKLRIERSQLTTTN
jgi:site-specific DNA-methyltransferase (adenine-specific)